MDTSETYIKMCDCEEIQNRTSDADWTNDDCISFRDGSGVSRIWIWKKGTLSGGTRKWSEYFIWLPRQDQLQEMVETKGIPGLLLLFYLFTREMPKEYLSTVDGSMEQLWLAFVMREKYNKVWAGKDWVEQVKKE